MFKKIVLIIITTLALVANTYASSDKDLILKKKSTI